MEVRRSALQTTSVMHDPAAEKGALEHLCDREEGVVFCAGLREGGFGDPLAEGLRAFAGLAEKYLCFGIGEIAVGL